MLLLLLLVLPHVVRNERIVERRLSEVRHTSLLRRYGDGGSTRGVGDGDGWHRSRIPGAVGGVGSGGGREDAFFTVAIGLFPSVSHAGGGRGGGSRTRSGRTTTLLCATGTTLLRTRAIDGVHVRIRDDGGGGGCGGGGDRRGNDRDRTGGGRRQAIVQGIAGDG